MFDLILYDDLTGGTHMTNVLFLCTGNSARSILSEVILRDLGAPRFQAFSAGSLPSGVPHPDGIAELERRGHVIGDISSKSWDVFSQESAAIMDIIVTVCGSAAEETCPAWPKQKDATQVMVHWGMDDPAYVEPLSARQVAFSNVYDIAHARIKALMSLEDDDLKDRLKLQMIAEITA